MPQDDEERRDDVVVARVRSRGGGRRAVRLERPSRHPCRRSVPPLPQRCRRERRRLAPLWERRRRFATTPSMGLRVSRVACARVAGIPSSALLSAILLLTQREAGPAAAHLRAPPSPSAAADDRGHRHGVEAVRAVFSRRRSSWLAGRCAGRRCGVSGGAGAGVGGGVSACASSRGARLEEPEAARRVGVRRRRPPSVAFPHRLACLASRVPRSDSGPLGAAADGAEAQRGAAHLGVARVGAPRAAVSLRLAIFGEIAREIARGQGPGPEPGPGPRPRRVWGGGRRDSRLPPQSESGTVPAMPAMPATPAASESRIHQRSPWLPAASENRIYTPEVAPTVTVVSSPFVCVHIMTTSGVDGSWRSWHSWRSAGSYLEDLYLQVDSPVHPSRGLSILSEWRGTPHPWSSEPSEPSAASAAPSRRGNASRHWAWRSGGARGVPVAVTSWAR